MSTRYLITPCLAALALALLAASGCRSDALTAAAGETRTVEDGPADDRTERCARHGLPVSACFICDPSLREQGRLWCAEHDRYEDRCFLCHPEIEDPDRLFCKEHNLYEDECALCHPELASAPAAGVAAADGLECREHRVLESECGICHPELAADLPLGAGLKIRFESEQSAAKAGVATARPRPAADRFEAAFLARVTWDENNYARVTPLVGGVLQQVVADVGETVSLGQRLATLSSPEVARSKSAYLSARADEKLKRSVFTREQELVEQKVSARQELERARAEYEIARSAAAMARQQLLNLGFTEQAVSDLERLGAPTSELDVLAPIAGTLVVRDATLGEAVASGDPLFAIARISSMWLELAIPERDVSRVKVGQEIVATFDGEPGLEVSGRMTWIGSSVDESSRMITGRAVVANEDRRLRHGMYGRARLRSEVVRNGLLVPSEAVQRIDERPYVFARLADDLFELRSVELGAAAGRDVFVVAGLEADDEIVVAHSFTLKSEFLKSRLGAGCVDE